MRSFEVFLPSSSRHAPSHLFQAAQDVVEVEGPFEALPWAEFWSSGKRQPYLIRNAFDPEDDATYDAWPTFDDIFLELSTTDQTRLIHHSPGNLSSFQVEPGPLEEAAEDLVKPIESSDRQWTILVNDVDRYVPGTSQTNHDSSDDSFYSLS
jgi:ribosomal protein L16 Arg81 hydroxylase